MSRALDWISFPFYVVATVIVVVAWILYALIGAIADGIRSLLKEFRGYPL